MALRSSLLACGGHGQMLTRRLIHNASSRPLSISSVFCAKDKDVGDTQVTHTGQKFEKDDYRLVRFVDKQKLVNKSFAIDLINSVPPAKREERIVSCDGGGGPLGHPKVYINLDKPGNHTCGYCGLRFTKPEHH